MITDQSLVYAPNATLGLPVEALGGHGGGPVSLPVGVNLDDGVP